MAQETGDKENTPSRKPNNGTSGSISTTPAESQSSKTNTNESKASNNSSKDSNTQQLQTPNWNNSWSWHQQIWNSQQQNDNEADNMQKQQMQNLNHNQLETITTTTVSSSPQQSSRNREPTDLSLDTDVKDANNQNDNDNPVPPMIGGKNAYSSSASNSQSSSSASVFATDRQLSDLMRQRHEAQYLKRQKENEEKAKKLEEEKQEKERIRLETLEKEKEEAEIEATKQAQLEADEAYSRQLMEQLNPGYSWNEQGQDGWNQDTDMQNLGQSSGWDGTAGGNNNNDSPNGRTPMRTGYLDRLIDDNNAAQQGVRRQNSDFWAGFANLFGIGDSGNSAERRRQRRERRWLQRSQSGRSGWGGTGTGQSSDNLGTGAGQGTSPIIGGTGMDQQDNTPLNNAVTEANSQEQMSTWLLEEGQTNRIPSPRLEGDGDGVQTQGQAQSQLRDNPNRQASRELAQWVQNMEIEISPLEQRRNEYQQTMKAAVCKGVVIAIALTFVWRLMVFLVTVCTFDPDAVINPLRADPKYLQAELAAIMPENLTTQDVQQDDKMNEYLTSQIESSLKRDHGIDSIKSENITIVSVQPASSDTLSWYKDYLEMQQAQSTSGNQMQLYDVGYLAKLTDQQFADLKKNNKLILPPDYEDDDGVTDDEGDTNADGTSSQLANQQTQYQRPPAQVHTNFLNPNAVNGISLDPDGNVLHSDTTFAKGGEDEINS